MRIIYFDLDCLRPDHMNQYGYHINTTPNLDRITRDGVIFNRCYTSNSPCAPSRAALFSGRFGINNGQVGHIGSGTDFNYPGIGFHHYPESPMWMRHLRLNGIKTVSFSSFADRHASWWFSAGWSELHTFTNKMGSEKADEVNAAVIPWLKKHSKEDNYFLHIHYWDIHQPYTLDKKWIDLFKKEPPPSWPDEKTIKENIAIYGPRTALDLYVGYANNDKSPTPNMPDKITNLDEFKMMIDGYDASIRYVDHHIGQILDLLEKNKLLKDTMFIISGDHGDCFGEQGIYMDHWTAAEAIQHIPLIINWPGIKKKSICDEFIYNLDLVSTVCELLNLPIAPKWDGKSFKNAVIGEPFKGRDYLICEHGMGSLMRAVINKRYYFTKILHPGLYPFDSPYLLHDIEKDPHQTTNIADKNPNIVKEMEQILNNWQNEQMEKHGEHTDNLKKMVSEDYLDWCDKETIERLKKTGREKQAGELIKRLSKYHQGLKLFK